MSKLKDIITLELNEAFSLSIINLDFDGEYFYHLDWCEVYMIDKENNRKLFLIEDTLGWILSCLAYATVGSIKRETEIYPDIEVYNLGNIYRELSIKARQEISLDASKEADLTIEKALELYKNFGFLPRKSFPTWMYCKDNVVYFELTSNLNTRIYDDVIVDIPDKYSLEMIPVYIKISDEYLLKIMGIVNYCFLNFYPQIEEREYLSYGIFNPFE